MKSIITLCFLLFLSIHVFSQAPLKNGFIKIDNGTIYKITNSQSKGQCPEIGDIIKMKLKKYLPDGTLQFSTDLFDPKNISELIIDTNHIKGDVVDVFLRLKTGEKAVAYIPTWVADKDESLKENNESYKYEISLVSFQSPEQNKYRQDSILSQLRIVQKNLFDSLAHKLSPEYKLTFQNDGLYILKTSIKKVKAKQKIQPNEDVKVNYLLKLLPGMQEIDNSYKRGTPFEFKVDNNQVISGWDIALKQLKRGDKAILLIPSWLAYSFNGNGREIEPNTPLYFEIEIL